MASNDAERPFPLHPNFWWGLLWCVGLLLFTQVPAGVLAGVVLVGVVLYRPDAVRDMSSPAVQAVIGLGVVLAHGLIIFFALLVLRIVAGRDWARQVGLRLPAGSHVVLALAVVPGFLVLGSAAYHLLRRGLGLPSVAEPPAAAAFWCAVLATLALTGLGQVVLRAALGPGWYGSQVMPRPWPVKLLLSVGLLVAVVGAVWGFYALLGPLLGPLVPASGRLAGMEEMEKLFAGWPLAAAVLVVGVFPALSEELWCRAFLGRGLVGIHGRFWGVLLTSLLFGMIHLDPCQGTMAVFMGLVLHMAYLATRSLLVPMLLHFSNNALAVVLTRIPQVAELEKERAEVPWHLLATATLLLATGLWALWSCRARLEGGWQRV